MSDNGNNFPEIPFGNRDDANGMASQALRQWAERYYAKMVEEKQVEEAPSMMDQLLEKAGNWVDQKNRGIASRGAGSGRDEIDGNGGRTGGYAG